MNRTKLDMGELLRMDNVALSYGPVRVLDGAGIRVLEGEIHALLGENGAGKSSLMKVLYGLYRADRGTILLRGEPVSIASPTSALRQGIAFIHQELPFAGHLSVAQNLFLGREPRKGLLGFIDDRRLNEEARRILDPYPIDVDPRVRISRLSIAQQQIVAIAGALSSGASLVVLDEATTALTEREAERLFALLESLAARGMTFIMITHRLEEVFRIANRVTVMRDGRTIASLDTADVTPQDLVRHMVGREVTDIYPARPFQPAEAGRRARLSARDLRSWKLRGVTFDVYPGEVLGIAGLMGAGRTSLFNALFGVDRLTGGTLAVDGVTVRVGTPADAIANRMAYVTEDRKANGLALLRGVKENVTLPRLQRHMRWGLLKDGELDEVADRYVRKLAIDARSDSRTAVLSGGNQQKVVLAKWLATGADVFLLDEPTRGIDVGSKLEVYDLINELTAAGKSVVLATSELPELMAMSDRLLVLSEGTLMRTLSRDEATPEQVVYYASMKPNPALA